MEILWEDDAIIVAVKPADIVSESTAEHSGFADLLAAHTGGYIGTVHRLDRGVGGVMVYAKTPAAAAKLSRAVQEHALGKEYRAVVHGTLAEPQAELRDLLYHDKRQNKSFAVTRARAGVKEALLSYEVLAQYDHARYGPLSLLRVRLHTGRTHQIRVQFSSRGHALLGDGKYGARDNCPIALFSARLAFPHPTSGRRMEFEQTPLCSFLPDQSISQ